jgi:hypothetical protein
LAARREPSTIWFDPARLARVVKEIEGSEAKLAGNLSGVVRDGGPRVLLELAGICVGFRKSS